MTAPPKAVKGAQIFQDCSQASLDELKRKRDPLPPRLAAGCASLNSLHGVKAVRGGEAPEWWTVKETRRVSAGFYGVLKDFAPCGFRSRASSSLSERRYVLFGA